MSRSPRRGVLTAAAAAAVTVAAGLQTAQAAPSTPSSPGHPARSVKTAQHGVVSALAKTVGLQRMKGRQAVFVQLSGAGAASVSGHVFSSTVGNASTKAAKAKQAALSRRAEVKSHADAALSTARGADRSAQSLFVVSNAVPGIGMMVDQAGVQALAKRSDVVKISAIVPKTASNAYPAQLTRVLDTWQDVHKIGVGVTVGIIDTGIDYTHQDFGGNGDYATAEANASSQSFDWRAAQPAKLQAKVVGGWDFVGDNYNADPSAADYQPVPHPDPNPLDCNEHGTHVAGTVAGYGENADGSTFTGNYGQLTATDLDNMKIGPGMAPGASLVSLKVFGCSGSTDVVIPALDRALDPNNDGDYSDHLDVVNLSLGSDYAPVDDPENTVVDALAANGVLPVIAMGNAGDLTDAGGSPGNAVRSLAVASSVDAMQLRDGLQENIPADTIVAGQMSVAYPWATAPDVTGDVVTMPGASVSDPVTNNADGCTAFTTDQASAVAGKVVMLVWDDNDGTRRCGSAGRSANARAAGAIGAIFTSTLNVFGAGITGSAYIPVFQVPQASTQTLWDAAVAGTLNVTFKGSLQATVKDLNPGINDLISSFSSRGPHGSIGVVKPDVAAPGDTIASAGMGTGDGVLVISGTSMATPHTAGIAALVRQAHPDWTVEQVKAAIMNTANHDLYTGENHSGDIYGPARDGAGRVDALSAMTTNVLAYDTDVPGAVSASFGVVEAPIDGGTVTQTRTVKVQNTGDSDVTYDASYAAAVSQPGVSYSFSPQSITVAAHSSGTVTITMTVDPAALRHTIDPTMAVDQLGVPRQFVADASGRMLLTSTGADGQVLRVPVYAAAKPVSDMSASASIVDGQGQVNLAGAGFSEGNDASDYTSIASIMQFGAASPKLPACAPDAPVDGCTLNTTAEGGDIRYVGAGTSTEDTGGLADGWLWFGLSTYGDNATLGNAVIPYVDFDTTGDGRPDYEVYVQNATGSDVLLAWLVDLHTGELLDEEPVNTQFGDTDTNAFDTNAMLIPVWPAKIGIADDTTSFPISYSVGTFSSYGSPANGGDIDHSPTVTFDAANPAVSTDYALYVDEPQQVPVNAKPDAKALVLHLHNGSGARAEVVTFGPGAASAPANLQARPGNQKVGLTWDAPGYLGAQPLTGYAVRYSADNGSTWINGPAATRTSTNRSATITGLTNGQQYVFEVAAINQAGTGAYTAPVAAMPVADSTRLSIGGVHSVKKGSGAVLGARLVDATTGQPFSGKVVLYAATSWTTPNWKPVTSRVTPSATGLVWVTVPISSHTIFQWRYAGDATHAPANSTIWQVLVTS